MYIDVSRTLGEAFDALTDTLLPHLLKLSGSTKKIVAEASQQVVIAIIAHAACPPRTFMPFLEAGLAERTVQSRSYIMGHLVQYIRAQCSRPQAKQAIEGTQILNSNHGTALALLMELIRRGLTDASAVVKESARTAFLVFYREWPKQGAVLLAGLEDGVRRQVEKAMASAAPVAPVAEEESKPNVAAPPAARRAPAARKPSSAIAAAIRKAKEEARAARMAEAAREEQEASEAPVHVDEPPPEIEKTPDPPLPPATNAASITLPETPRKKASLLDLQTPEAQGASFKVMTPAPLLAETSSLLETTGMSLVEPPSEENVPSQAESKTATGTQGYVEAVSTEPIVRAVESEAAALHDHDIGPAYSRTAVNPALSEMESHTEQVTPSPAKSISHSPDSTNSATNPGIQHLPYSSTAEPRRPRVSISPTQTFKPQPLYKKLRKLGDCSFWLARREGESFL